MPSATEMKNTSLDAKREEFRKYLEKEGVLEYLTKHLVPLYEKADKPTSALEYLKNNFAGKEVEEAKQKAETLESENKDLKKTVERLETENVTLTSKVADLEKEIEEVRKNEAVKVTEKMDEDFPDKEEEKPEAAVWTSTRSTSYRLVADNGVCRSKEYVSLSKCFKYYSADSPGACEDGCTASNSCVGYYYGYNYGRGYYYCALLPSSITSSTCPSGFNLESDFQRKCRTVKSSDDIVGSTSYQYGWQCYAKN